MNDPAAAVGSERGLLLPAVAMRSIAPMRLLPEPTLPPAPAPRPDQRGTRLLLVGVALAMVAALQPWLRVRFDRLFGDGLGPPGWQSSAGFTCLCSCALVGVLTLAESGSSASRHAVRPASLLLVTLSTLVLLGEWWRGPGLLRGVTAQWTLAFYGASLGLGLLLVACGSRLPRRTRARRSTP